MNEEHRQRTRRLSQIQHYKTRVGVEQSRQAKLRADRAYALRLTLYEETRQGKRETFAVTELQRLYRGHIGRAVARKWKVTRAEIKAEAALRYVSAVTLQRAY